MMKLKFNSSFHRIGSTAALAKTLSVGEDFLLRIASNADSNYKITEIPKKNGGVRVISDPALELKRIQRRIVRRIFSTIQFPAYLFGSIKDEDNPRDFVRNAEFHSDAAEVMSFDIESFFPSTHARYIKKIFKYFFNMPDDVSNVLVKLTTLDDSLPQGAPTSPYIANLVFYDTEYKIVSSLSSKGFKYSRLVDDITISSSSGFSGKDKTFIHSAIRSFVSEKNLKINEKKFKLTNTGTAGKKTIVTGLVIESGKVKLPKEVIKEIGSNVHKIKCRALVDRSDDLYHRDYESVSGYVSLYRRVDSKKSEEYRRVLRHALPVFSSEKIKKIIYLCNRFCRYAKSHPASIDTEAHARKYYRFIRKIAIIRRTDRKRARDLLKALETIKPLHNIGYYYE